MLFQTWDSYSVYSSSTAGSPINFCAPDRPSQEEQVLGVPELRLTASTKTESKEGVKHAWRLATLILHVKHYKLNSPLPAGNLRSPTGPQTILTALSEATGLLAKAWMECGTFWSLVLVNSKFSRLCVLDVVGAREGAESVGATLMTDADVKPVAHETPLVFTIALEVSPWLVHRSPNGRIDLSTLLGTNIVDPHVLLSHDLIYSYHATANPAFETQKGDYPLNYESMAILWGCFVRAIDLIGTIPMGEPLRRIEASSESFKLYSDKLLSCSQDVIASSVTPARPPTSKPRTCAPVTSETLEPLPEPLIRLNDAREHRPVSSTGIGSHSELTPLAARELYHLTSRGLAVGTESAVDRGNNNPEVRTWLHDVSLAGGDVVAESLDDHSDAGQRETRLVLRFVSSQEMDILEQLRFTGGTGVQGRSDRSLFPCCLDSCCIA